MKWIKYLVVFVSGFAVAKCVATVDPQTIGEMLCNIKVRSFQGVFKLIYVFSYVSGFGVLAAAIFKLKQVKDNPTQIPVSTPLALFATGTILMFLPSILVPAGETIFGGSSAKSAYTVGEGGAIRDDSTSQIPDNLLDGV